jgi:putative transposase
LLAGYKGPEDLIGEQGLLKQLTKALVERALNAELTHHLGYEKHDPGGRLSGNSRNGTSRKKLKGDFGEAEIAVPRDRNGSFTPQIVPSHQRRFTGFDDKILSMYARGMTTREIQGHLEEIYGVEVSPSLISSVTDAVIEEVKEWQSGEDAARGAGGKSCRVRGVRHRSGRPQGRSGPVDQRQRGRQVLVAIADRDP